MLIKGDNLEVLKHLSEAYNEKIKMIYIDPPYNTGKNSFVYQDRRRFTIEGVVILTIESEDCPGKYWCATDVGMLLNFVFMVF